MFKHLCKSTQQLLGRVSCEIAIGSLFADRHPLALLGTACVNKPARPSGNNEPTNPHEKSPTSSLPLHCFIASSSPKNLPRQNPLVGARRKIRESEKGMEISQMSDSDFLKPGFGHLCANNPHVRNGPMSPRHPHSTSEHHPPLRTH